MEKPLIIDVEELALWEIEQEAEIFVNFVSKSGKVKDPGFKNRKRLERIANNRTWYGREDKVNRRLKQKNFRAQWKLERSKEKYHIPRNREYKTYGYLTW